MFQILLHRIGWESHLKPFMFKKLPVNSGYGVIFGTLAALLFIVLAFTGIFLAFYYNPSPDKAYQSCDYIINEIPMGNVLRGLHHWAAGAMVLVVFIHMMITYFAGTFKAPRELTWLTGACLFLITLILGFSGYLLPWDMKAYWATVVGASIPKEMPLVGEYITRFLLGGDTMSGLTLTRFYALHVLLLPALFIVFMVMHIYLIRIHGMSDPSSTLSDTPDSKEEPVLTRADGSMYRFYPEHLNRTFWVFGGVLVALLVLAVGVGVPKEEMAGTLIANYLPRPEWYYMWLFQLLTYFSGAWETVGSLVLPFGGVLLLFAIPFMGESRLKGIINRPVSLTTGTTLIICIVYLTLMAYAEARPYGTAYVIADKTLSAEEKRGLKLYIDKECAYCHNIRGTGGHRSGPDMGNIVAKKRSQKYISDYITEPTSVQKYSVMPKYAMPEKDLQAMTTFLQSLNFSKHAPKILTKDEALKICNSPQ